MAGVAIVSSDAGAAKLSSRWAGHQVVFGERRIPFMGTLKTRTDTFVLAELSEEGGALELRERPCHIEFAEVAGVKVRMEPETLERLPEVVVRFRKDARGQWAAGPWGSGFGASDDDGDGHPGVTLEVEAPLCGGRLYVRSEAESLARAQREGEGLRGELKVRLKQHILGAEGSCLSALASDSEERLSGKFRYAPVEAGTDCAAMAGSDWPRVE
ncbi:MAG: hypothetical protein U1E65_28740 [Myxococcota bacterium]